MLDSMCYRRFYDTRPNLTETQAKKQLIKEGLSEKYDKKIFESFLETDLTIREKENEKILRKQNILNTRISPHYRKAV